VTRAGWAALCGAAAVLLAATFAVVQLSWYEHHGTTDLPVYQHYAALVHGGHELPYRDFALEYPPAALAAFLVPAYLPWSYGTSFAVAMGVCGLLLLCGATAVFAAVEAWPVRAAGALALVALSPLVLGTLVDERFDLWPAALAVCGLAALLHGRPLLAGALGGLAFAAKLWPALLAPAAFVYLWRRHGPRAALGSAAVFVAVAAACFLPFAVLAPAGLRHSFAEQLGRPLQVESLGAAVLMAAHHLGGLSLTTVTTHGSQNLSGSPAGAVAAVSTGLEVAALLAIWLAFATSRRPGRESLLAASAASVAVFVAFGKVFSPQFLVWLVALVPLVRGRRGLVASGLLVAALLLTEGWFASHYWDLALSYASPWSWLLLARDLAVVAVAGALAWPRPLEHEPFGEHRTRLEALQSIRPQVD
jgi:uncharacterized membrane protein